jgi:hypothetical protein
MEAPGTEREEVVHRRLIAASLLRGYWGRRTVELKCDFERRPGIFYVG